MEENWTNKKIDKFMVVNNLIGQGAFGKVYRGFYANDESKQVACKVIPISAISNSAKYLDLVKREISVLQQLVNNQYIVKLLDVARTNNNLYIFLEYCGDGDLKEYIKQKRLSEKECILFFKHIVEGFKDLDKRKIIHRDIKPANLLLHSGSIKISDFGFARHLENTLEPGKYTRLGSPLYMAPQILQDEKFSGKCDVWSVGIVFYEILFGKTPWMAKSQGELLKSIKKQPLSFPSDIKRSPLVKDMLTGMLKLNEEDRFGWKEVFAHPLMNESKPKEHQVPQNTQIDKQDLELQEANDKYLEQNLVVGYLDNKVQEVPQESDKIVNQSLIHEEPDVISVKEYDDLDKSHINAYEKEKELKKSMFKINAFIMFERNISVMYKYTVKMLFICFCKEESKIGKIMYNKVMFCLCKNQVIHLNNVQKILNEEVSTLFTDQTIWKQFKKSIPFKKTKEQIEQDIKHSMKFYSDISKKIKDSFTEIVNKDSTKKTEIEDFMNVVNDTFENNSQFKDIYKSSIKRLIKITGDIIKGDQKCDKSVYILVKFLIASLSPYSQFPDPNTDINKFYEDAENCEEAELRQQILDKLPTYQ